MEGEPSGPAQKKRKEKEVDNKTALTRWSNEENRIITDSQNELGLQWTDQIGSEMAKRLLNRSKPAIKSRWEVLQAASNAGPTTSIQTRNYWRRKERRGILGKKLHPGSKEALIFKVLVETNSIPTDAQLARLRSVVGPRSRPKL